MARTKPLIFIRALALTASAALIVISAAASADTPNPFVGKWVLNVAKSTFDPPQPPKSNTATTTETSGGGLHTVIDIVEADGSSNHMEYTVPAGGAKATPVTGSEYADSIIVTQVNARTIKYTLSKSGKTIESGTLMVSKSGKTMQGPLSGTYENVHWKDHFLYDRQ
jgi:hypothetical protein